LFSKYINVFFRLILPTLKHNNPEILNIAFILLSFVLAVIIPFQLFIFSYAILGPLHYLTEIAWLHKKQYFVSKSSIAWQFAIISALLTICLVLLYYPSQQINLITTNSLNHLFTSLIILALAIAAYNIYIKQEINKIALVIAVVSLIFILNQFSFSYILFAIFLPTLVHVFVFTLIFMVVGAIKTRNKISYTAIALFVACSALFLINFQVVYDVSSYFRTAYQSSNFSYLASYISNQSQFNFKSSSILKAQRFIAFAYTYHYLNWFVKTNITEWNKLPQKTIAISIIIWLASVSLYIYNFKYGFIALFFLSTYHVLLELPLNIISIKNLIIKIKQ